MPKHSHGVSVDFFVSACSELSKQHGVRRATPAEMEALRSALADAEQAWLEMPPDEMDSAKPDGHS